MNTQAEAVKTPIKFVKVETYKNVIVNEAEELQENPITGDIIDQSVEMQTMPNSTLVNENQSPGNETSGNALNQTEEPPQPKPIEIRLIKFDLEEFLSSQTAVNFLVDVLNSVDIKKKPETRGQRYRRYARALLTDLFNLMKFLLRYGIGLLLFAILNIVLYLISKIQPKTIWDWVVEQLNDFLEVKL